MTATLIVEVTTVNVPKLNPKINATEIKKKDKIKIVENENEDVG